MRQWIYERIPWTVGMFGFAPRPARHRVTHITKNYGRNWITMMDATLLLRAENEARAEFRQSDKQPEDWKRLAGKLEAIVKAGGNACLIADVTEARQIALAVTNIKVME